MRFEYYKLTIFVTDYKKAKLLSFDYVVLCATIDLFSFDIYNK
jgi:hypothetical protein